jgi:uncharacterized Zn-finger protein
MNVQLYDFNLEYSLEWAEPYWMYMRLTYAVLVIPTILSIASILLNFYNGPNQIETTVTQPQQTQAPPAAHSHRLVKVDASVTNQNTEITNEDRGMLISCPKCKRVFNTPMLMLDFEGSKGVLVNVCPYCNRVLGRAENGNGNENDFHNDFRIATGLDDKVVHQEKQRIK